MRGIDGAQHRSALPMTADEGTDVFLGRGRTGQVIRQYDWANNPLGPIQDWSHSLRAMVGVILESAFPQCIVWGPEHITLHNDAFLPILGRKPEAIGRPFDEVWHEVWQAIGPLVDRAYAGQSTFIEDYPLVVQRAGYPEQVAFTFCYSPIRDDDGQVAGMLDTVMETTSKVRAEKHSQLINAELAHRIQNTLTIINSIADQTLRTATSLGEARTLLSCRISALGHAHEVLTRSKWNSAPIGAVIEGALAPHQGAVGEICAQGPPLNLSAKQALTLGMAIHERATNAVKYGALSVPGGEVTIRWQIGTVNNDECLRLTWVESNGPTVTPPVRRGFGSRLIEQVLAEDFRGKVDLSYPPQGVRCELVTKISNLSLDM